MNDKSVNTMSCQLNSYYERKVEEDLRELTAYYPFTKRIIVPTNKPSLIKLDVVAIDKDMIDELSATEDEICGEYSKRIIVQIPIDYPNSHCIITGGKWIDSNKINPADRHYYEKGDEGVEFCVGVPDSVKNLDNVLLENVRTVDNLLVGYEMLQKELTSGLEVRAYSHGDKGIIEYNNERRRKKHGRKK